MCNALLGRDLVAQDGSCWGSQRGCCYPLPRVSIKVLRRTAFEPFGVDAIDCMVPMVRSWAVLLLVVTGVGFV